MELDSRGLGVMVIGNCDIVNPMNTDINVVELLIKQIVGGFQINNSTTPMPPSSPEPLSSEKHHLE